MRVIVIALDDERANILSAGLELSGYHNNVFVANTPHQLQNAVAESAPQLLVVDYSVTDQNTELCDKIHAFTDIPKITIGNSPIQSDANLPFPYHFNDLLTNVYALVPLQAEVQDHPPTFFVSQEESEAKYRDLFDRASDGIFLIDLVTHIIIDANIQVEKIYGYSVDEVTGMSLLQIVPHEEHPAMLKNTRKMRDERGVLRVKDRTHFKKDGSRISVSISASLIEYGGRIVFQDIVRDETARIQQEAQLKQLNQMKDEFVSNISHELRTPLTSLKIRMHLLKKSPDAMDLHLTTIEREIGRLGVLIENMLILSRLDQDREMFAFSDLNVNELVREYYSDRKPVAEEAGLSMSWETSALAPMVYASHDLLGQVLSILLTNAINYTPSGGEIMLTTDIVDINKQNWVKISVRDTGIGITSAEQDALFERFYRGQVGQDSQKAGTGLGLAIAKEIVDRHNGRITVESEGIPGKGTTFSVWLQLEQKSSLIGL